MNNETEKAMWSCKTSDTPWTFSSLLKKAVARFCLTLDQTLLAMKKTRTILNS